VKVAVDVFNLFDAADSDIDYFYTSRLPGEPADGIDDIHTRAAVVSYAAMRRVRQHFAGIVGAWLLCQASAMVLVPVSLCTGESAGAVAQACTCSHPDGRECPMHHTKTTSRSFCSCRSTTDGPIATLASLIGPIAVLTSRTTVAASVATSGFWTNPEAVLFDASVNPDPPPPRA
jgi:hypothetical protein